MSNNAIFHEAISALLREIFDGPPGKETYILNSGDPGLLNQLDSINSEVVSSRRRPGKTTIASHMKHVSFGMSLLNRSAQGEENPWAGADWDEAWKHTEVSEKEWTDLRGELRQQSRDWQAAFKQREDWNEITASGAVSSVAHTAYHLGAIRQILAANS